MGEFTRATPRLMRRGQSCLCLCYPRAVVWLHPAYQGRDRVAQCGACWDGDLGSACVFVHVPRGLTHCLLAIMLLLSAVRGAAGHTAQGVPCTAGYNSSHHVYDCAAHLFAGSSLCGYACLGLPCQCWSSCFNAVLTAQCCSPLCCSHDARVMHRLGATGVAYAFAATEHCNM